MSVALDVVSFIAAAPNETENDNESKAIHTFHKGQRFSRKLKRRLTLRTVAEARALKKQSKEAIHVLIYAAELVNNKFSLENDFIKFKCIMSFMPFRLQPIRNWH